MIRDAERSEECWIISVFKSPNRLFVVASMIVYKSHSLPRYTFNGTFTTSFKILRRIIIIAFGQRKSSLHVNKFKRVKADWVACFSIHCLKCCFMSICKVSNVMCAVSDSCKLYKATIKRIDINVLFRCWLEKKNSEKMGTRNNFTWSHHHELLL